MVKIVESDVENLNGYQTKICAKKAVAVVAVEDILVKEMKGYWSSNVMF